MCNMKRTRGSITVFICIILAALIPLCGILMDLVRYNEAVRIAQSSLKLCAESMLAAYDRQMKEQFGLLAMHPREAASLEKEIYELLSDNLTPESADGNVTDLFRFKVRRVEVIPYYNLSEPYVLEQQVAEFMKYRAPVQAVSEFLEKLKSMTNLAREGEIAERNIALDKLLNGLRADMIYFALLLDQKMKQINKTDRFDPLSQAIIDAVNANNWSEMEVRPTQETINAINEKMAEYRNVKIEFEEAKDAYESAKETFSQVEERMNDLKERLEEAKSSKGSSEEEGEEQDTSEADTAIQKLEAEISRLQPEYNAKKAAMDSAWQAYQQVSNQLRMVAQQLNERLKKLLDCYEKMYQYTHTSMDLLRWLKEHLELHEKYCAKAIELGQNLISRTQEVQHEKQALESVMEKSPDSALVQQVNADLEKKLISVDPRHIGQILERLEQNRGWVTKWLEAATKAYEAYLQMSMDLDDEIRQIKLLIEDKGDGSKVVSMYRGNDKTIACLDELRESLTYLRSYSSMKSLGVYDIPEYQLVPPATEKEQQGFDIWHAYTFEGKELVQEPEPENPGLENARQKTGQAAQTIAEGKDGAENGPGESGENESDAEENLYELLYIPSRDGAESSEERLAAISEHVWQTRQDRFVLPNPLEDPVQGLEKVNEKDRGFFDHELERIRKFFETVGHLLADAGESLIKSLYVNEYIVSAFKNYTTVGNALEHDIGWNRPLDKTWFKRAEVEYIIFGHPSEQSNIAAAKRTLTVIRLVFNLLHVYTDPEKLAFTFKMASSIAGWTIFGVPVVQNFLLVSWAALESWLDAEKLMAGEQVPLIKTSQSWFLDPDRLKEYLIDNVIAGIRDLVQDKAEELIDKGAASLEETVMSFINGQLDAIFSGITDNWYQATETVGERAKSLVNNLDFSDLKYITGDTVESLLESLREYMAGKLAAFCDRIRDEGVQVIAECKKEIQNRIRTVLFESDAYKNLKEKVKDFARDTIDKGFDMITDRISGVLGASGGKSSGASNVLGRLIMMDYTDYLRLMLLTVTPEQKALRCADLMQLNLYAVSPDTAEAISNYHTALYVKAWIDIDLWVIPEAFFKKDKEGMIVVEWAQGY